MGNWKLHKSKKQGDLGYQIKEEGYQDFIDRCCMDILSETGVKIGEITGYELRVENIRHDMYFNDGRNSFFALDALSQLCCNLWGFLNQNEKFLDNTDKLFFLNRMSFLQSMETIENHKEGLALLHSKKGTIVYSLGSTELDDDFPENSPEDLYQKLEEMLKGDSWSYSEKWDFYLNLKNLDLDGDDEKIKGYRVQENEDDTYSLIYEREGFTEWKVEIADMNDENEFIGSFRTAFADGKECEQFTLLPAEYSDQILAQVRIFKKGDIQTYAFVPASIVVFKRKKLIKIELTCNVKILNNGEFTISLKEEY